MSFPRAAWQCVVISMDKAAMFIDGGYLSKIMTALFIIEPQKRKSLDLEVLCQNISQEQDCELL